MLTFGSLFAGIGGIDLGFERAGMECKWQVEIDDYAQRVLAKHWPNIPRFRDIREFPPHPIDAGLRVDVVAGGFPCQDISYAGKGAGLDGERSGLFYELIRVVREMGPRYVVLENVAALFTRGMGDVLGTLASFGFDAEWHCIQAADVGAPHIRDRVFIVAGRTGDTQDASDDRARRGQQQQESTCEATAGSGEIYQTSTGSARRRNGNGWWDIEPAVGRVANGVPHRVDRLRGLGNAVVPQVAEYVARMVLKIDDTGQSR